MRNFLRDSLRKLPLARRAVATARGWVAENLSRADPFRSLAYVARRAGPHVIYLDVGCHRGATIQRYLDLAPASEVFGFDPNPENIRRSVELLGSDRRVRFVETALSDEDGRADFFENRNEQTSSLLRNDIGNRRSFPADTVEVQSLRVATRRLDTWVAEHCPAGTLILKCDTQGADAKVIRGGVSVIRERAAAFYGEVMLDAMYEGQGSFEEIRSLLEHDCGMVLRDVYPCMHDRSGRAVQMDVLWVKPEMLAAFRGNGGG